MHKTTNPTQEDMKKHPVSLKAQDETRSDVGHKPLSLLTFLLCITAASGVVMVLLHMLSLLLR